MNTLIALLVVAVVVLIAVIGAYFIFGNKTEPQAERKWTDPKFHD